MVLCSHRILCGRRDRGRLMAGNFSSGNTRAKHPRQQSKSIPLLWLAYTWPPCRRLHRTSSRLFTFHPFRFHCQPDLCLTWYVHYLFNILPNYRALLFDHLPNIYRRRVGKFEGKYEHHSRCAIHFRRDRRSAWSLDYCMGKRSAWSESRICIYRHLHDAAGRFCLDIIKRSKKWKNSLTGDFSLRQRSTRP